MDFRRFAGRYRIDIEIGFVHFFTPLVFDKFNISQKLLLTQSLFTHYSLAYMS